MTIARKLWLGFGALLLIFLLASLVIFLSERSISAALEEITGVEEPARAASFEMEINAVEMSRDVLDYLETGDGQYRELFENDSEDFERFESQYADLADTQREESARGTPLHLRAVRRRGPEPAGRQRQ